MRKYGASLPRDLTLRSTSATRAGTGWPARLTQVADCERVLRAHGFRVCRVRYFGPRARIEVAPEEVARLREPALLADITARFRAAGFDDVEVDPEGYRQGALNALPA